MAIKAGNITKTQDLIASGVDVNRPDSHGHTPLHIAALRGNLEIVQILITAGANIKKQNLYGYTPLHCALLGKDLTVVQELIAAGTGQDKEHHVALHHRYQMIANSITTFKQQATEISRTVAQALHPRLGIRSPMSLLPQDLIRHIVVLSAVALAF